MATKYAVTETVLLKAGEYKVQLSSIDEIDSKFNDEQQLLWTFILSDGPHAGMEIMGYTSLKMTRGLYASKAVKWANILSGAETLDFDGDKLIGCEAVATIIPKESKSDSTRRRNHIDSLAPAKK